MTSDDVDKGGLVTPDETDKPKDTKPLTDREAFLDKLVKTVGMEKLGGQ